MRPLPAHSPPTWPAGADAVLAWPPPECPDLPGYYSELARAANGLPLLALAGPLGGAGAILAIANVEPERCAAAFAGDAEAQRQLADVHLAVRRGGIPVLKRILAERRGTAALSRS
jgi:hypothetical protein